MNKKNIQDLKALLSSPKKIVVIPHKNPDGDAIGSCLAIFHYLQKLNHDVTVISPNSYPDFLKWIPGEKEVMNFDYNVGQASEIINKAQLIFTLDFNDLSRVDNMKGILENSKADFIMIDHHQQPGDYAKIVYSDIQMSSTCEMVYNFIEFLEDTDKIDADIATCLYVGIMTDTGSFRYASTTSNTHRVIANLIDKGANNSEIHNLLYDTNSLSRLHLLGCALKNLVQIENFNTTYITLTKEELMQYDFKKGDTEGLVNYGLSLQGVKFAVIFIEDIQEGHIKISLRSKGNFSVNDFARQNFSGGGHTNAAGGRSDLSMQETVEKFKKILLNYKDELQ
jgi:phosphoesterase RecJ-like protein